MAVAAKKAKPDAVRKAESRARKLEAGIVSVTVDIPDQHRDWFRATAKALLAGGDPPGKPVSQEPLAADVEPTAVPALLDASLGLAERSDTVIGHDPRDGGPSEAKDVTTMVAVALLAVLVIGIAIGVSAGYHKWHRPPSPLGVNAKGGFRSRCPARKCKLAEGRRLRTNLVSSGIRVLRQLFWRIMRVKDGTVFIFR
jgi:hypothetical protein